MAEKIRPWSAPQIIWSALIAIVLWSAFGFNWFGQGFNWETSGGAKQMSKHAVRDAMATICVAQARMEPEANGSLIQFGKLSDYEQRQFIEKANWATMPGSESAESGVAKLCAAKLRET